MGDKPDHYYGGQAVLEGVMMRGKDHWAVAVRKPKGDVHIESHDIGGVAKRHPWLAKPLLRGIIGLGQALSIGVKALTISANQSVEEEERLSSKQTALSMTLAMILFIGLFVVGPALLFNFVQRREIVESALLLRIAEGVFRVLLFLGYLFLIGRMKEIRRVFQYHGAEHKTIAAYEHDEPLDPERVDSYSTLHVRCGTNFLLIVMILAILFYAVLTPRGVWLLVLSRVLGILVIASVSYEVLRLGAKYHGSPIMRALMAPGLWLQKITTKPPSTDQIEIAIASFNEVLRREREAADVQTGEPAAAPGAPPGPAISPDPSAAS